ncbi:hypothetical protein [Curtobacterium sp. PsM8]|uniref:hypothetical protein n=1 Tax=Curtobacterium sp. PsM8 TaxID=3030532 RepID=UPI00263A5D59|nr:hypothetical protein [Curtobacterium sp. PsM8]MDN4648532.1 hypothetical protein [Curtobacterium sp. PsM8]
MKDIAKNLYIVAGVMLTVGYLGLAAFYLDVNYGPEDGGANIGLGLLSLLSILAGALGIVVGITAVILTIASRRRRRS